MLPGLLAYSFAWRVLTWTLRLFVLWKLEPQWRHRTRLNFRGVAVDVGLHFTCRKCCLRPPAVKYLPQCLHFESFGLFRRAILLFRVPLIYWTPRFASAPKKHPGGELSNSKEHVCAKANQPHEDCAQAVCAAPRIEIRRRVGTSTSERHQA